VPPVLPAEFEALIVQPEDTLAEGIIKTYVRLPVLIWKVFRWAMNDDGTATKAFRDWICEGCNRLEVDAIILAGQT